MSFLLTTGTHKTLRIDAESVGINDYSLFFYNGELPDPDVVVTFNNRGGWLSYTEVDNGENK